MDDLRKTIKHKKVSIPARISTPLLKLLKPVVKLLVYSKKELTARKPSKHPQNLSKVLLLSVIEVFSQDIIFWRARTSEQCEESNSV